MASASGQQHVARAGTPPHVSGGREKPLQNTVCFWAPAEVLPMDACKHGARRRVRCAWVPANTGRAGGVSAHGCLQARGVQEGSVRMDACGRLSSADTG